MKAELLSQCFFLCFQFFHFDCDAASDRSNGNFLFKEIPSIFPDRSNPPGLKAPEKLWWAKEITPDFHVCGRLSRHDMKLAVDAGFKSIVSLFTYPEGDPEGDFGGDSLPTTETERKIVEDTLGLQFVNLLDPLDEWASVQAVEKFTLMVPHLKKPALLRCDRGYTISFVTMLYLANQTRYNPHFKPKMSSRKFYDVSHSMGLDFLSRIPMEVVSEITGDPVPNSVFQKHFKPDYNPEDWLDYWYAHPVYKNWFIAGQIMRTHLGPLQEFGYKSVVNLRLGITHDGVESQEEVNLLNIKSGTGTYGDGHILPRQHTERLRATRIESGRRRNFISNSSDVNFEHQNPREFGDEVGYNEQLESHLFKDSDLDYVHLPLKSKDGLREFFTLHRDKLMKVSQRGPVLVHCSDGSRAAYVTVLAAALQYDLTLEWALGRLKEMGFGVGIDKNPSIFHLYKDLLQCDIRKVDSRDEF